MTKEPSATMPEPTTAAVELPQSSPADIVAEVAQHLPVTIIERRKGWQIFDVQELWRYRELLYFLTWRDIKIRYKQTVLGAAWAVLQPLATMVVFTLFLGKVAGIATEEIPYPLFVFAGTLPWAFFSNAITSSSQSIIGNQNLITKIYFPRLLIPMGAVGAGLVDLGISLGLFVLIMLGFGFFPSFGMLFVPLILLLLVISALGVGTLLSALTVAYRDFKYVVPFGIQLWMFATPCIYMQADQIVSERTRWLLPLNPAYGLIDNFRSAMLGQPLDPYSLAVSGCVGIALFLLGCWYFRSVERGFADII